MSDKTSRILTFIFCIFLVACIALLSLIFIRRLNAWDYEVDKLYDEIKEKTNCVSGYHSIKGDKILYLEYDIYNTPYRSIYNKLWDMEDKYPDVYFKDCSKQIVFDSMWETVLPYIKGFYDRTDATCIYYTVNNLTTAEHQYYYTTKFDYKPVY